MNHNYIKLEHKNPDNLDWFVVNWCLGNVCNYSCSYCPEYLHNSTKPWPLPDVIKKFIIQIKNHFFDKQIYFEFTGGEVTMYKHFESIAKFCHSIGIRVGLISNGSRTIRYWQENKQYFDHICLSFHSEFADADHFVNVVKTVHMDVKTHVNIMMNPNHFDLGLNVARRCRELGNLSLALQPLLHDMNRGLFEYSDNQKTVLDNQYELITKNIPIYKQYDYYRGAMRKVRTDGSSEIANTYDFINEKSNDWSGWNCYAGLEQIVVDTDGTVFRGWCKQGGEIGNIHAEVHLPELPVLCASTNCACGLDIMCTKEKI
jgi:MoaA/NifB/PqqE/SkfB family radical SAM enzyme